MVDIITYKKPLLVKCRGFSCSTYEELGGLTDMLKRGILGVANPKGLLSTQTPHTSV